MCGRYGFGYRQINEIYERWAIEDQEHGFTPRFNVAPSQEAPIVVRHSPNHFKIVKWGFMPKWMEGKKGMRALINARSDNLLTSKTYFEPLKTSRCIVPATNFYEWKKISDGKIPYCFKVKGEEFFSMAGLIVGDAFVIITTEPNETMAPVHNRMPVILQKEDEDKWLNPDTEVEELYKLLIPYPDEEMEAYPISSLVNSPKNDFEEILKPFH